ncbi:MAG: nuclear transport factor 2 family protein [Cyclobacteriaceae bacterium]|nr:nuclear transport factor 2 family protein [Cyclobacteriaceae bacterium]MDX5465337.1 nuclear transport factor 2 family protein [Cyclobacteriaceae bacterium]
MKYLLLLSLTFLVAFVSPAQDLEVAQILAQREASNQALRNFNEELNNTFMTDDALITTGAGTLISGKQELQAYIQNISGPRMYWIRTPDEVIVNPETQLAWESGTWKGYVEGAEKPVVGGKYSAQWTKKSGTWLIQSQLFVALPIRQ